METKLIHRIEELVDDYYYIKADYDERIGRTIKKIEEICLELNYNEKGENALKILEDIIYEHFKDE